LPPDEPLADRPDCRSDGNRLGHRAEVFRILFGEPVTLLRVLGIGLIVAGIAALKFA